MSGLAPGLRLGWLAVPDRYVAHLATIKDQTDRGSASLEQLAFADFLARGEFDGHLRHMCPIYRQRRDALLDAIARHLPGLEPAGASAGLHVVTSVPDDVDEAALVGPRPGSVSGCTGSPRTCEGLPAIGPAFSSATGG